MENSQSKISQRTKQRMLQENFRKFLRKIPFKCVWKHLGKGIGKHLRNTQRKALGKYQEMSSDMLLVNASDNTYRNASFIHLFIFNLFNLTKINICKHYKRYNKSSVNYMLISINSSYKKNKRTTKSPMFNEF